MLVAATDEVVTSGRYSEALLTRTERARAHAFRQEGSRRDFIAAHVLVRIAAGHLLGEPAYDIRIVQRCERCGGSHGRPTVPGRPGVHLSMAHTEGVVAAAAGWSAIGVDIERTGQPPAGSAIHRHVLSTAEMAAIGAAPDPHRAFLRLWVRKEALVKIGVTTLDRMGEADLAHLSLQEPDRQTRISPLGPCWPGLQMCDWVDEERGIAAAAVCSRPPRIAFLS